MRYSKYARDEDRDDYEADRRCAECERYLMRPGTSYCPTCKPERWDDAEPLWHESR